MPSTGSREIWRRCWATSCPLCRMPGHQLALRFLHTHTTSPQNVRTLSERVLSHVNDVTDQWVKRACAGKRGAVQQHKSRDPSVLWRSATVQSVRHVSGCSGKACKNSSWRYFQTALAQEEPLPALHSGVECTSCDLGDRARAALLTSNQASLQHSMDSEVSLCALCCRSSPHLAMSPCPSPLRGQVSSRVCGGTSFRDAGAVTVSAIAAVSPDGGSNWMAAEELGPL